MFFRNGRGAPQAQRGFGLVRGIVLGSVQADRLVHVVLGFTAGNQELALLDYGVTLGDPSADDVWQALASNLARPFAGLSVSVVSVDAGFQTSGVSARGAGGGCPWWAGPARGGRSPGPRADVVRSAGAHGRTRPAPMGDPRGPGRSLLGRGGSPRHPRAPLPAVDELAAPGQPQLSADPCSTAVRTASADRPKDYRAAGNRQLRARNIAHFITDRLPSPDIRNGATSACAAVRPSRAAKDARRAFDHAGRAVDEVTHADADETRDSCRTDPRRAPHQR